MIWSKSGGVIVNMMLDLPETGLAILVTVLKTIIQKFITYPIEVSKSKAIALNIEHDPWIPRGQRPSILKNRRCAYT
jgi:hypothetical protein